VSERVTVCAEVYVPAMGLKVGTAVAELYTDTVRDVLVVLP
jgi:hypothetical protein